MLHNFVRSRDGYRYDDISIVQGLDDLETTNITRSTTALTVRNKFANYLMTEGQVEWQYNRI